jgi:elongation factor 2 kinase
MTVERFIDGSDEYGKGYVKHNTNSGFVDEDMHRLTPQTFSAHSFYASGGERMVVDVQGVGDLYTDPQVPPPPPRPSPPYTDVH